MIGPRHEFHPEQHLYYCTNCDYRRTDINNCGDHKHTVHYRCVHPDAPEYTLLTRPDYEILTPKWCPVLKSMRDTI